jgi:hypothetical protein
MGVRVLLILVGFMACGCGQSSPPQAPGEKGDVETGAGAAAISWGDEGREEQAESSCRAATYVSNEDMGQQEIAAFFERVANETLEEMEGDPLSGFGSAEDATLNRLGVPRYQACEN